MLDDLLRHYGLTEPRGSGGVPTIRQRPEDDGAPIESINPSTGEPIATVVGASEASYERTAEQAVAAFQRWRTTPPPSRGEIVRRIGLALRAEKERLGRMVTWEVGKIRSEGEGEVQEMIDMADFAVGLSRQLYGRAIASERPEHRMFEQWHPLGPVGIITAFNFPVAVWSWNALVAAVCGDSTVWKPAPAASLTALAVSRIVERALEGTDGEGLFGLVLGGAEWGRRIAADERFPLVSATGSCAMGRALGPVVAERLGRSLLELGGNNAVILSESAHLDLALRAVTFAAVGTAGQRCTTLRRLIIHESIADRFVERLAAAYRNLPIGDPWEEGTLVGPLINASAVQNMLTAIEEARAQGAELVQGGAKLDRPGFFVEPAIVRAKPEMPIVARETFAPLLYVLTYRELDEAIAIHNQVEQGLSSAIFTERLQEAERFLSPVGSDCGIANVNLGTSGAEIGGAFGGEKATGGGREAGSDSWKAYMRRQTCTVNYGDALPLAQGVRFEVEP